LEHSFFHRLSGILWTTIVTAIVALALYVSFGRLAMSNIGQHHDRILAELNARLPFAVAARQVSGDWHSFSPEIVLSGLRLTMPGNQDQPLELAEGRLELDVWRMLISGSLQTSELRLKQLRLRGELTAEGSLRLAGLGGGQGPVESLQGFLLNAEHIELADAELLLSLPDGSERDLRVDMDLIRTGGRRQLSAAVESSDGTRLTALAEGVGNPFRPETFAGELYLDMTAVDVQALRAALPDHLPAAITAGRLDLELWLAWELGEPRIEGQFDGSNLLLAPAGSEWEMPVERITFNASLVENRDRWTLFASDLVLRKNGHDLVLPRVRFGVRGDSIRLLSRDVSLAQLNRILVELEVTPPGLEEVFRVLQPAGWLSALELNVADYRNPAAEWLLQANFHDLVLDSWKGAPGASAASGYVKLGSGGGQVVVDARDMALEFPTVYREPLRYQEIHGTVNIDWFEDAVVLSSGLISARGEEGDISALFALNIPLTDTEVGLEMDLLAGVSDTPAGNRSKYLPYILDASLYDWLEGSIDEGMVQEGGFIWRGSLRAGLAAARTVQLFFDVVDASLAYHPKWPPISSLDGLVLIDDTSVSIWSEQASLYNTRVSFLSAEAWKAQDQQIRLQLDARLQGAAADGLTVVRESPLNAITSNAFDGWRMDGELATDLQLELNLTDNTASPRVTVEVLAQGGDLKINPGGLLIAGIKGQVAYSSETGFSSSDLQGRLWDQPLQLAIGQQPRVGQGTDRYDPASSVTGVSFETRVAVTDISDWLGLPALGFASGRAAVAGQVRIAPGVPVQVAVASDLKGVALDLPTPWDSSAAQPTALSIAVSLGQQSTTIELALQEALRLDLHLTEGMPSGGALAFGQKPGPVEPGLLTIAGQMQSADVREWQDFLQTWWLAQEPAVEGRDVPRAADDTGPATRRPGPGYPGMTGIRVAKLGIDSVDLWGREFSDLVFSAELQAGEWRVTTELDWLRAELLLAAAGSRSRLDIDHLDFAALQQPSVAANAPTTANWQIPDMDVVVRDLSKGGRQLGELAFALHTEGDTLIADNLSGDIAGLQLRDQDMNRLEWHQGNADRSALRARLHFGDLGRTLERFDYQRILETSAGTFNLELEWPGGPQEFALAQAQGLVSADVAEGRFLDTPPAASGALKVVSILNLAEIVARLSLTHMFESGISFRRLEGEAALHGGTIEVAGLNVRGASSGFQYSGLSSIADRDLQGELVVTLPVANNLPWVAALAAGLPVAAGVFVVSKVFEKQFNQLSSAVYEVTGNWDDPQVNFSRIFDVESQSRAVGADAQFRRLEEPQEVRAALVEPELKPEPEPEPEPELKPQPAPDPEREPSGADAGIMDE
jgi:uncharacterized protein (TIGR02099 family)